MQKNAYKCRKMCTNKDKRGQRGTAGLRDRIPLYRNQEDKRTHNCRQGARKVI